MQWKYNDKEIECSDLEGYVGFVYIITNLINNKKYIGKKNLTKSKIYFKNKKKKRKRVTSDWENYYGSSEILLSDVKEYGKENFERRILHLCLSKSEMSYLEAKEQFIRDAILSDEYYNDWLSVRIRRAHLKTMRIKQ